MGASKTKQSGVIAKMARAKKLASKSQAKKTDVEERATGPVVFGARRTHKARR